MRIKVGDMWYDSTTRAVLVEFSAGEQDQIAEVPVGRNIHNVAGLGLGRYAVFPENDPRTPDAKYAWIAAEER